MLVLAAWIKLNVVQNHCSDLLLAGAGNLPMPSNVAHAELIMAIWKSLEIVLQQSPNPILVEFDCKAVVNKSNGTRLGVVIEGLQRFLHEGRTQVKVNFCSREAHGLAKIGFGLTTCVL